VFNNNYRFVKLLQNQSLEASHPLFFNIFAWKSFKKFWTDVLGDPTFSSSPNASRRSAINFTTETERCRSRPFPILLALICLTG